MLTILRKFVIVSVIVISGLLMRYLKPSAPGHQLIYERCDESKGVSKGVVKRNSGPTSRGPRGDSVAVKAGDV